MQKITRVIFDDVNNIPDDVLREAQTAFLSDEQLMQELFNRCILPEEYDAFYARAYALAENASALRSAYEVHD